MSESRTPPPIESVAVLTKGPLQWKSGVVVAWADTPEGLICHLWPHGWFTADSLVQVKDKKREASIKASLGYKNKA